MTYLKPFLRVVGEPNIDKGTVQRDWIGPIVNSYYQYFSNCLHRDFNKQMNKKQVLQMNQAPISAMVNASIYRRACTAKRLQFPLQPQYFKPHPCLRRFSRMIFFSLIHFTRSDPHIHSSRITICQPNNIPTTPFLFHCCETVLSSLRYTRLRIFLALILKFVLFRRQLGINIKVL